MAVNALEIVEASDPEPENKKSVVHDIPVTYHEVYFTPLKKPKQKLAGDPISILKFEDIMTLIMDYDYSSVELDVRDRYTFNISGLRLSKKGIYECVINCNDSQAEDIIKNNRKKRKTEIVSFNVDESHLLRCHVLFYPLADNDGLCARMLLEGNRKVSEQTVRLLLQKIINQIDGESFRPEFFEEDYAGALPTEHVHYKMQFSVKAQTNSVTDQEFVKQLESGDFYHIIISEKNIGKVHKEAPFLNESLQTVQFKPVFTDGSKGIQAVYTGVRNLAKKIFGTDTSKATKEIAYKICYPEGSHKRTVNFNPTDEHTSDFAIKRRWINKFERQNKSQPTIFDDNLCRRISNLLNDDNEENDHEKNDS